MKTMRKILPTAMLSAAIIAAGLTTAITMPAPAAAQETRFFIGISGGQSRYPDKQGMEARLNSAPNISGAEVDNTATGYKVSIGFEGAQQMVGLDYIHWGQVDWKFNRGTTAMTSKFDVRSGVLWYGYALGQQSLLVRGRLIPRVGYAATNAEGIADSSKGKKSVVRESGLLLGLAAELDLSPNIAFTFGIDHVWEVGELYSAGLRFRF